MKKFFVLLLVLCVALPIFAFDYVPKNIDENPFGGKLNSKIQKNQKTEQAAQPEKREITNLKEYFMYLPAEVHRHWTPYKANVDYEVTVQFTVHRNGSISDLQIVGTNYPNANASVLNAVKAGAPYQPIPRSFTPDSVKAQVVLEYHAK